MQASRLILRRHGPIAGRMIRPSLTVVCLLLAVSACRRDAGASARAALHAAGYSYTVAEFHRAAREGDRESVRSFITAGMNPAVAAENSSTALSEAASHGQGHIVTLLLGEKVPLPPDILTLAVQGGDAVALKALMQAGATTPADGSPAPLELAASLGHTHLVSPLATSGAATDRALMAAAATGHTATLAALLDAGASPMATGAGGTTALMLAARAGHREAALWLAGHGAAITALDAAGHCAPDLATAFPDIRAALLQPSRDRDLDPPLPLTDLPDVPAASLPDQLEYLDFGPAHLPLILLEVTDTQARFYMDGRDNLTIQPGEPLADTGLTLQSVKQEVLQPVQGPALDVSRALCMDVDGAPVLLIQGITAVRPVPAAVLRSSENGALFEITDGAVFKAAGSLVTVTSLRPDVITLKSGAWAGEIMRKK